jgi:hypothetical protein
MSFEFCRHKSKITKKEKRYLLDLLCQVQIEMLMNSPEKFDSEEYAMLERLKIKIKDIEEEFNV